MNGEAGDGWSGGCQCGQVRFRADRLGAASFCHCRMCQKALGGTGAALVAVARLRWTRGEPKRFQSSNVVRRGFCADCGTPLTYEHPNGLDVAIATFDRAGEIRPAIQLAREARLPWADDLPHLPVRSPQEAAQAAPFLTGIVSHQHPDHDTDAWPPAA
jgi:hypothetical protein